MVLDVSCKSDNPPKKPEVLVDVWENGEWVRIPTTLVELWANKDGPSDITRTAKVKFPAQWGDESVIQYINGFKSGNGEYDQCRIYLYDHDLDTYQIAHYGYVGGVGPAAENGVMKFWVYDPADLMRGINVSKAFGEPTIAQMINFAISGVDDNGRPVGIQQRSVFDNIKSYIAGVQSVKAQKEDTSDLGGDDEGGFTLDGDLPVVGQFQLNVNDLVDDIHDFITGTDVTNALLGSKKRFQLNRHNMVDLMEWFASNVDGKWHFEPTEEGPLLFFDNTNAELNTDPGDSVDSSAFSRRKFIDKRLEGATDKGDISDIGDRDAFTTVTTLDNQALYDIKPFNTLELYGESHKPLNYQEGGVIPAGVQTLSERFPYVKIKYPPLIERSGGYEYSASPVESDKTSIEQAENQAKKEFRKHLEEETEGTITIKGEPYILPYDYITTVPVCNDSVSEVDQISYEVNAVKHRIPAGGRYTTELGVSLVFDETKVEIESQYMEA